MEGAESSRNLSFLSGWFKDKQKTVMDKESNSKTTFSRLKPLNKKLLKPRSVYNRMVVCEEKASPHSVKESSNPFANLNIKIVSESGRKRKMVDGKINDYSSPHKIMCSSNGLSPDLGCFMDYSLSPSEPLNPKPKEKKKSKETAGSNLGQEPVKDKNPAVGVVEDDNGYLSAFPLCETKECKTEDPPDQQGNEKSSACSQHSSFLTPDCSETESGPLRPVKCDEEFLEEEEVLNIGQPIFESSVCQPAAGAEQKSGLSEALSGTMNISHTYNSGYVTLDALYETTLPSHVQEKSEMVVPSQMENIDRPASSSAQPGENESSADQIRHTAVKSARHHRPKILDNSMEWEDEKRRYIFSVRSHMKENPGGAEGPMTELLDLMTHVAGQTRSSGYQWQHPSDLTCRNYQKRFSNETPTMTLNAWVARNQTHHSRFSKVPRLFKRSQFP